MPIVRRRIHTLSHSTAFGFATMVHLAGPTADLLVAIPVVSARSLPFGVFLDRTGYRLAHLCLWLFHALCATYFVAAGRLYRALATTQLAGMLQLYSLTIHRHFLGAIGIAHYIVAALYVRHLLRPLTNLVPARFHPFKTLRRVTHQLSTVRRQSTRLVPGSLPARVAAAVERSRPWTLLACMYNTVLAPRGFFGVENRHFEILFLAREISETVLQTNQAYQMSRLLPRADLNRVYVAVLIINCWSTPLFYWFGGRNKALQRLLCLLGDIVLDFVSAVGVPVWLGLDYFSEYDPQTGDFPLSCWYNDTWVVRFMNDAPLILLGGWVAALSRFFFSISLVSSLDDIRIVLKLRPTGINPKPPTLMRQLTAKHHVQLVRWAHLTMAAFGAAILSVQLVAESRPMPATCVLVVRPWFETQPACALVEINCLATPRHSSNGSDFDAITGSLDEFSLEHIVIRHCPQVEFTERLQMFPNLIAIKVYNSTIAAWSDDAAITQTHHPRMRFLYLVHTRFPNATLPPGLISREFPTALKDIEISGSNINWLPDDLHDRWPLGLTLFLEYAQLTTYPHVITKLNPRMLALCGNPITQLPPEALLLPNAYSIAFTGSQLTVLPDTGIDPTRVYAKWIFADSTNVAALPAWMDEPFLKHTVVYLGGSPFCVDVLANETSPARAELLAARPYITTYIDCFELEPLRQPFYPQYLEVREDGS